MSMRCLTVPFRAAQHAALSMARATARATAVALGVLGLSTAAMAAEPAETPPSQNWSFTGLFGTYDRAELQRGLQVYLEVCAACHSTRQLAFRHLQGSAALGFSDAEVRALAAQFTIEDGPDDVGEMFMRPRLPSDRFPDPFPNEQAARFANSGALPPDLSLITKAREHGPDYVYAFLRGFIDPPADVDLRPGMFYNRYFPGHQLAMPDVLFDGGVDYADGTDPTAAQQAWDLTAFLSWAAEPTMETRKATGIRVVLFLIVFAGILFVAKRKVWSKLH